MASKRAVLRKADESILADADRDRQFVEAVRENFLSSSAINAHHQRIYGTPCTAKEKV